MGENMRFNDREKGDAGPVTQQYIIQNVGVLGTVAERATVTNQQTATATVELDLGQVSDLVKQVRSALSSLPEPVQREVQPLLERIEGELKTDKSNTKIREWLSSLRKIGENVTGNLTAQGIVAMVRAILGA